MKLKLPKFPFWLITALKIIGIVAIFYSIFYTLITDDDREGRELALKKIEKGFVRVNAQDIVGFWIEQRKADRNFIPGGDRTKYLFITHKKDNLFSVEYKIDSDSVYTCTFLLSGNELNGRVPGFLGMVQRKLIFDGHNELMYGGFIYLREGVPQKASKNKEP